MSGRPDPVLRTTPFSLETAAANPFSRAFYQWSVVASDIDAACLSIQKTFGAAGFVILENAPMTNVKCRGEEIDLRIDLAIGYLGELNIEVISPRPEGQANVYSEFLEERAAGGLHHLAYRVYDFDAATKHMEAQHGAAVQTGDFGDDGTRFAYYDTRSVNGVFTEVIYLGPSSEMFMDSIRVGKPITSM